MKFNNLYSLLFELNSAEVEEISNYLPEKKINYGPLFEKERTIIAPNLEAKISIYGLIKNWIDYLKKTETLPDSLIIGYNIKNFIFSKAKEVFKNDSLEPTISKGQLDGMWSTENLITRSIKTEKGSKNITLTLSKFLSTVDDKSPKNYYIVVSHDPRDILGGSIDKLWTSCTDRKGCHSTKPYVEITNGGMIAYLMYGNPDEVDSVLNDHQMGGLASTNTVARISIRRYYDDNGNFIYVQEPTTYLMFSGNKLSEKLKFADILQDYLDENNKKTRGEAKFFHRDDYTDELGKLHSYHAAPSKRIKNDPKCIKIDDDDNYDYNGDLVITDNDLNEYGYLQFNLRNVNGNLTLDNCSKVTQLHNIRGYFTTFKLLPEKCNNLIIKDCDNLESLIEHPEIAEMQLNSLVITGCEKLNSIKASFKLCKNISLDNIKNLKSITVSNDSGSFETVSLKNMHNLDYVFNVGNVKVINNLLIDNCNDIYDLSNIVINKTFSVTNCNDLESILNPPKCSEHCDITISNCDKLTSLYHLIQNSGNSFNSLSLANLQKFSSITYDTKLTLTLNKLSVINYGDNDSEILKILSCMDYFEHSFKSYNLIVKKELNLKTIVDTHDNDSYPYNYILKYIAQIKEKNPGLEIKYQ